MNTFLSAARDKGGWLLAGWRPLWHLLSRYPLLFVPVALVLGLLWGVLLGGFDAPHVLWADDARTALAAGLAVGGLFAGVAAAAWWLDKVRARPEPAPPGGPYVAAWVVLGLLAITPAVFGLGLFPTAVNGEPLPERFLALGVPAPRVCLPLGVALTLLVGLVGYARADRIGGMRWLGWGPALALAAGYVVLGLIHWACPEFYLPLAPAPVTALLLLGLGVLVATGVHRGGLCPRCGQFLYPVALALGLVLVFFGGCFEPQHQVPGLDPYDRLPVGDRPRLDRYAALPRHPGGTGTDADALVAWANRASPRLPDGTRGPVVVLCVSGGASTSAVFVARSLFRLEARFPGFVDRVRLVGGASGGMLGAAYFVSQFRPGSPYRLENRAGESERFRRYLARLENGTPAPPEDEDERAYWAEVEQLEDRFAGPLEQDFLSPLFQKWVHKDLNPLAGFFPRHTTNDRGLALEAAWDRSLLGRPVADVSSGPPRWDADRPALGVPFADLGPEERRGEVPSLVFTPMMVEDGRQLIISNLDLDYMTTWGSYEPPDPATFPAHGVDAYSAVEFYRLFPEAARTFRLGTAVRLNASFPLLSPAAELPTNPPRRVVDAGYYDNYGLIVASRWVERNGGWLAGQEIPIWVVQLWTYGYDAQSTSLVSGAEAGLLEADGSRPAVAGHGSRSSVAPAQGLFAAWRANMAYRGEERLNQVLFALNFDRFYAGKPLLAYRFRKDIGKVDLPMNWVLTGYELAQIEANGKEFRELAEAVRKGVRPAAAEAVPRPPAVPPPAREKADLLGHLYQLSRKR